MLSKSLSYAVTPVMLPLGDKISEIEEAICSLPDKAAEEVQEEMIMIVRHSRRPKDNLMRAEKLVLRSLWGNTDIRVLPADKGDVKFILNMEDHN
jgi:hypothetical protein